MSSTAQPLMQLLQEQLIIADQRDNQLLSSLRDGESFIDVPTAGKAVSSAYEQLRNAAEYSEEHLILQRAIKRFYHLNIFTTRRDISKLSVELISELVLAGYLPNNAISKQTSTQLDNLITTYIHVYDQVCASKIKRDTAMEWVLACLSTETEIMLNPHERFRAFIAVSYQYFLRSIDRSYFSGSHDAGSYELCLYIAIHQALLKSDVDIVRADLQSLYSVSPNDTANFILINQQVDYLFSCQLTISLRRLVVREGAPFRVLKGLIGSRRDLPSLLNNRQSFMDAYRTQTANEYSQVEKRLDSGLIRSIIFIFITKTIIGVSIEIPYDLYTRHVIEWVPLIINLIFPAFYMAVLRLGVRMPSSSNAKNLAKIIEDALYEDSVHNVLIPPKKAISTTRQIIYTILFAIPISLALAALYALDFNIVQMMIFFVFFSTASSLGFRLSSQVRELEINRQSKGLFGSLRDFFYLPFIVIGQWLSSKYRQLNIVARLLDLSIELPLKAVLRLVRQWIKFLDEQHEQLY